MIFKKKQSLTELITELNEKYHGELTVYGLLEQEEPIIEYNDKFKIPDEFEAQYQKRKQYLENIKNFENRMNHNEPHIVLKEGLDDKCWGWLDLKCLRTDYATCQTMRLDAKQEFPLITGNALVWCKDTGDVIFQKRNSGDVDKFPDVYSIWGGGFLPVSVNDKVADGHSIYKNINREFMEETGNVTRLKNLKDLPLLVTREHMAGDLKTGSIQFNALGAEIPEDLVSKLVPTWEGGIECCKKESMISHFENNNWTPFAVASILIWLNETDENLFSKLYSVFKKKSLEEKLGITSAALKLLKG